MPSSDNPTYDLAPIGRAGAYIKGYIDLNPSYNGFDRELIETSLIPISATESTSVFALTVKDIHTNGVGNLHGGCAALIFDLCTSSTLALIAKPGFWDSTSAGVSRNLNVTYIRPVPLGTKVTIESEIVHAGRQLATLRGVMRTEDGKVVSTAEHTRVRLPVRSSL